MPDESTIRSRLDAYVEAWRSEDREAFLGLWSDDAHWEDPVGSAPMRGRNAIAEFWDKTHAAPMTLRPEPERVIVCGAEAMLSGEDSPMGGVISEVLVSTPAISRTEAVTRMPDFSSSRRATAPAATRATVSLPELLPPPRQSRRPNFFFQVKSAWPGRYTSCRSW